MTDRASLTEEPVPGIAQPLPDEDNPPIIDAHRTFLLTVIAAGVFVGAIISFVM